MTTTEALVPTGRISTDPDGELSVSVVWSGGNAPIDRPDTGGWLIGPDSPFRRKLAQRLVRAIDAGVVHSDPALVIDNYGHTYVSARRNVMGRRMNADLKRLGF